MTYRVVTLSACRNRLCGISFDGTSAILKFCCDRCRSRFLALRAVASLLVPLGKQKGWRMLEKMEVGREDRPKQGVRQGQ